MHIPTRICTLCLVLFTLVSFAADAATPSVRETDASITVSIDDQSILTYHKADVPPPEGADPIFTRSGFIHPVHSPSGTVVTGIHPDDHYHHLGLWHAWVECEIEGENVDFWNLKEETGRVRYAKTLSLSWGSESAGFTVLQEHVVFPGNQEKERVAPVEAANKVKEEKQGKCWRGFWLSALCVTGEMFKRFPMEVKNISQRIGSCLSPSFLLWWPMQSSPLSTTTLMADFN